jgi:hypothetical protein
MKAREKFEFVDADLGNELLAVIIDKTWYANNYDDICTWLEMQGKDTGHMKYSAGLIFMPCENVKDLFILRWA